MLHLLAFSPITSAQQHSCRTVIGEKLGDVSHHGYGHTVRNADTNSKAITNPKTCFQCFQMYKTHQL